MLSGTPFSDALDRKLHEQTDRRSSETKAEARPPEIAPHPFVFVDPRLVSDVSAARIAVDRRGSRILTANERQALEGLQRLGARLSENFTKGDLHRAYRALALRYHPDRYAASGQDEQRRLSRVFSDVHAHYQELSNRFLQ